MYMKRKLVSIIMPTYNCSLKIGRCIESIINQKYADFELIIVDDGSTDDTKEIVEKYIIRDKRIKYFYKENGGVSSSRNFGISKSVGDYVYFVDSDDEVTENSIVTLVELIEKFDCDFVKANYFYSKDDNREYCSGKLNESLLVNDSNRKKELLNNIIDGSMPTFVWTVLLKKEFLMNIDLFDEQIDYMEDKVFYFEIFSRSNNFYLSNEIVYFYYFNDFKNKSVSYWEKYLDNINMVFKQLMYYSDKYDNGVFNDYIRNCACLQINNNIYNLFINNSNLKCLINYFNRCESLFISNIKCMSGQKIYSRLCIFSINNRFYRMLVLLYLFKKKVSRV